MTATKDVFFVLDTFKTELEDRGYKVLYLGLYGSQNYNLHDKESDIDCKAIIMPSLHDIIFRNTVSTTINTEYGDIDVKDLVTFYSVIRKGNFSYIEAMATKYWIGNQAIKDMLGGYEVNLKSVVGAAHEKRKAMLHEYPSKKKEFKKFGYDPKQLHHILRLNHILDSLVYLGGTSAYITYDDGDPVKNFLLTLKRGTNDTIDTVEKAVDMADDIIGQMKEHLPDDYKFIPTDETEEISSFIENEIVEDLKQ